MHHQNQRGIECEITVSVNIKYAVTQKNKKKTSDYWLVYD